MSKNMDIEKYNASLKFAEDIARILNKRNAISKMLEGLADQVGLYKENDEWKIDREKLLEQAKE